MNKRKLRNLEVSTIGFGAMGFTHGYGPSPEKKEAIKLMRDAFDLGCTFFDTAEGYGNGENEKLVGEALKPFRKEIVLATKFKVSYTEANTKEQLEKSIRNHLDASLKRLGTE